jgi:hypothetical protein
MVLGEARYAAGDVENEASRVCAALSRGGASLCDQLRLCPLNPLGE